MKGWGQRTRCLAAALVVAALAASPALAAAGGGPGSLDRGYAKNGVYLRGFGQEPGRGGAEDVLTREDGAALLLSGGGSLTKVGADGAPDPRFGKGGFTVGSFGIAIGGVFARGIAPAGGGKFLLFGGGGERTNESAPFALSRYLPDGRLDRSFGKDGDAVFEGSPPVEFGADAAVTLRDGKTLAFGWHAFALGAGFERLEEVRLRRDGTVDRSFGKGGFRVFHVHDPAYGVSPVATLTPAGRPLFLLPEEKGGFALFRFRADGDPDPSFGDRGVVEGTGVEEAGGMALGPGGEIVVTGPRSVAVLAADGAPQASFPIPALPGVETAKLTASPAVDAAGRILLGGSVGAGTVVVRLRPDGSLDPEFGDGRGFVTVPSPTGTEAVVWALAALPDGGVLGVGGDEGNGAVPGRSLALRLDAGGHPDAGYGAGGALSFQPRVGARAKVTGLAVTGRGSAVAGASIGPRLALAGLRPDGSTDRGFAKDGIARGPSTGIYGIRGRTLARAADGRLLIGGGSAETGALLARYLPGGRPDRGFGEGGIAHLPMLRNVLATQVLGDGSILAAGTRAGADGFGVLLVRLHPDGRPDRAFGGDGGVPVPGFWFTPGTMSLALAPGGQIVVAAAIDRESSLVELTAKGRPAKDFGEGGHARLVDLPDYIGAVAVDREGRIVLAGSLDRKFVVERFRPDGSLDLGFGRRGRAVTATGSIRRSAFNALALEPDGAVVAAGARELDCGFACTIRIPTVVRYRPDGSADPTFARHGMWTKKIGQSAQLDAVALAGDRILVGGWEATPGWGSRLMVVALHR